MPRCSSESCNRMAYKEGFLCNQCYRKTAKEKGLVPGKIKAIPSIERAINRTSIASKSLKKDERFRTWRLKVQGGLRLIK